MRTAIDDYTAAITAALDGGAKAIAQRNALGKTLRRMLRQLAHYVEANCRDDMTMLLSSGFQAASRLEEELVARGGPGVSHAGMYCRCRFCRLALSLELTVTECSPYHDPFAESDAI